MAKGQVVQAPLHILHFVVTDVLGEQLRFQVDRLRVSAEVEVGDGKVAAELSRGGSAQVRDRAEQFGDRRVGTEIYQKGVCEPRPERPGI